MHELKYKPSTRRWHAYRKGSYACPLHSGDLLALEVADRYLGLAERNKNPVKSRI